MMKNTQSRRTFIKYNALAGMGTILATGTHSPLFGHVPKHDQQKKILSGIQEDRLTQLGGMSLQDLLDYHRNYLYHAYIPNWDRGVDWEFGGFANLVNPNEEPNFDKKGMYFQGRAIWIFSYLFNNITGDKRHLEAAVKGRDFVKKHALTADYKWISFVSRDGEPLSKPLDHYGDIYMIMGLAELYKATHNQDDLDLAIETAKSVMERLLSPSYQHIEAHISALEPGTRRLPSWQHLLYSLNVLLKIHRDPVVEYMARYCVRVICEDHWQPETRVLLEVLDDQFRPYTFDAPNWGDFKPRGIHGWHSIQACWIVMDEALRVQHDPTYHQGVEMEVATLEKCYIEGKGMPFDNRGYTVDEMGRETYENAIYPWGALDDMLVYCLMVLEHSHEPFAIHYYDDCFSVHNSIPENIGTNGLLHTPRRFFHSIEILERILARDGRVSGLMG